jgi:hypothetical protein
VKNDERQARKIKKHLFRTKEAESKEIRSLVKRMLNF